jgi:Domain of unknown function (DUF6430)
MLSAENEYFQATKVLQLHGIPFDNVIFLKKMNNINLLLRVRSICKYSFYRDVAISSLAVLGVAWLALESVSWAFPVWISESSRPMFLLGALVFAVFWGVCSSLPVVRFTRTIPGRSLALELTVGDILDPKATDNIAILSSDYFDSCCDTAISTKSLKGQLIRIFFDGSKATFDAAIDASLRKQNILGIHNSMKQLGKNRTMKYPVGTAASVSIGTRKAILTVGANFNDSNSKTTTTAQALWCSLLGVWDASATLGHREPIAVPIWGANLGNAPGNRLVLFQTLLCSLAAATASSHSPPTKHLKIFVREGDYNPAEFRAMVEILKNFEL